MTEYFHSFFSYLLSLEGGLVLAETKFQLLSFILVKLDCLDKVLNKKCLFS